MVPACIVLVLANGASWCALSSNDGRSGSVHGPLRRECTDSYVKTSFGKQTVSGGGSIGQGALGGATAIPCSRGTVSMVDSLHVKCFCRFTSQNDTCRAFLSHAYLTRSNQHPPPNTSRPWWCIRNSNGREGNNGYGRPIAGIANEEYYPRRYGGCARYLWFDVSHFFRCFVWLSSGQRPVFVENVLTFPLTFYHSPPTFNHSRLRRFCLQCMCNSQW